MFYLLFWIIVLPLLVVFLFCWPMALLYTALFILILGMTQACLFS